MLALRLFYLQVLQGVNLFQMAERQYQKKVKAESYRGKIEDRNGSLLVDSVESMSLFVQPKELDKNKMTLKLIQDHLKIKPLDLDHKKKFIWIERKCNPHQVQDIIDKNLKGLGVVSEQKRYYPNGTLACHLIGTVGLDNHGLAGIELSLDSFLSGKPVYLEQLRDGKGRRLLYPEGELVSVRNENQPSQTVLLTIDRKLQYIAEKEIERAVLEMGAKKGMILIQNPMTGEMLSMASYPRFDPNSFVKGPSSEAPSLKNGMISDLYEPGSTFKIVTFAAALEEKKFKLDDKINCENGDWKTGALKIHDHEPSGIINFAEVLEKSSNIGSAKIGLSFDKEQFYKYIRAFGFGSKTGIQLPGEIDGLVRSPKDWSQTSLPTMAFGQEVGVTALQMIGAFSVIANGGTLMEPMIIKELQEFKNGEIKKKTFKPQVVRRVISNETANIMKQLLIGVVDRGTGGQAKVQGFSVAGKTGTAQKFDPEIKKYSPSKYVASFCGFLPAEDPRLVCLVLLDEPKKDYWGGSVAAPVFSRTLRRAAQTLDLKKDIPNIPLITLANKK